MKYTQLADWEAFTALKYKAQAEVPPITRKELDTLCTLASVTWEYSPGANFYVLWRSENCMLFEMGVDRSAREFVQAFQYMGLL